MLIARSRHRGSGRASRSSHPERRVETEFAQGLRKLVGARDESAVLGGPEDDGAIIHVNKFSVVTTARAMLHAAGFRDVEIKCGRHSEEVLDGQVSCQFDFTPLLPVVRPAPPTPARAEPLKKPEPDIFDDADAVTLQRCLSYRSPKS